MKIKKRHILLAALVFSLSAAVYLNWSLSDKDSITVADTKELGVATYVNKNVTTKDEVAVSATEAVTESKQSSEQAECFATYRSERQKAQDNVLELAMKVLDLVESSEEAKEEAVNQLSKLEDIYLSQNRVETTLKAKGFTDCVCYLSEESCTVIVPDDEMKDTSVLIIKDCIDEVADIPFENINIVRA